MTEITRPPEVLRALRGHDFYPTEADGVPPLYAQDGKPAGEAIVYVHYFAPFLDAYVTEYEPETGTAFGWVCLNGDLMNAEWGYIDLPAYESIAIAKGGSVHYVERDQHFEPAPARDVLPKRD